MQKLKECCYCDYGNRRPDEWCFIQHRYSSSSDSGSNRYRSKIWIQEIPSSDATGICGCYGRQSFSDRSTWKSDRTECTSGNRYEVRIFRICYRWFTDSDRRNFIYATIGYKLLPNHDVKDEGAFDTEKDFSDVPAWKQWLSLIILVLTLLAMIFEDKIGIKLCISGGIGALLLILTGVISEKEHSNPSILKQSFFLGVHFLLQQLCRKQEPVN